MNNKVSVARKHNVRKNNDVRIWEISWKISRYGGMEKQVNEDI